MNPAKGRWTPSPCLSTASPGWPEDKGFVLYPPRKIDTREPTMSYPTALLVVHNPTSLEAIKGTFAQPDPFSFDARPGQGRPCPRVGRGNVVPVLAHLPAGGDEFIPLAAPVR